ncbi:hypothetical protein I7I50_02336 [Histoplasma capsulatum G186AR]|uniref:Uncharacterized protein n=1 Tax=Ajellomyces capsulatus TaxID=5037 RepID=A0A8H8D5Y3_AJECA|nr:hypothetical protein I7I52_01000 [Histoplasma capsulatum]QSS71488.1 hypothetical protein I7I50_02336 [Histoplasma capsulatum G186AR]
MVDMLGNTKGSRYAGLPSVLKILCSPQKNMVVIHVSIYAGYLPVHEAYISLRPFYHKNGRRSVIYCQQDIMFYLKLVTVSTLFVW